MLVGRIVLQGERDGFARYENKVLSDFAGQLGVTFQITINVDDQIMPLSIKIQI